MYKKNSGVTERECVSDEEKRVQWRWVKRDCACVCLYVVAVFVQSIHKQTLLIDKRSEGFMI